VSKVTKLTVVFSSFSKFLFFSHAAIFGFSSFNLLAG